MADKPRSSGNVIVTKKGDRIRLYSMNLGPNRHQRRAERKLIRTGKLKPMQSKMKEDDEFGPL